MSTQRFRHNKLFLSSIAGVISSLPDQWAVIRKAARRECNAVQSIEPRYMHGPASSRGELRVVHGHTQVQDDSTAWLSRRSASAGAGGDGGDLMRMNQNTTAKLAQAEAAATAMTLVAARGGGPAMAPDSSDMPPQSLSIHCYHSLEQERRSAPAQQNIPGASVAANGCSACNAPAASEVAGV